MFALMRRMVRVFDRRPRPEVLQGVESYRRALDKASAAVPDDPTMRRVLAEFRRAEERLRARHG
jgi:hypothetical protein